jgi:hypothetical protein
MTLRRVRGLIALGPCCMLVAALVLTSCGSRGVGKKEVFPTTGELFVGGQPAVGAIVGFHPKGSVTPDDWPQGFPRAVVAEDGKFSLSTYGQGDGCPAGEYIVVVNWPQAGSGDDEEAETLDRLGGRYAARETSPLAATVETKPTQLKRFDLP